MISPVHVRVRGELPRVLAFYPVITSDKPSSSKCPKGPKEYRWKPKGINNIKEIKQAVVLYDMHLPFVREMVITWA